MVKLPVVTLSGFHCITLKTISLIVSQDKEFFVVAASDDDESGEQTGNASELNVVSDNNVINVVADIDANEEIVDINFNNKSSVNDINVNFHVIFLFCWCAPWDEVVLSNNVP